MVELPLIAEKIEAMMVDMLTHAQETLPDKLEQAELVPEAVTADEIEVPEAEETTPEEELTEEEMDAE